MGSWPELPSEWENDPLMKRHLARRILDAEVDLEKDTRSASPAAEPVDPTSTMRFALEQKLHETLLTNSSAAIERARSGAQFVQTAASAIGVLYTGVLAVIFVSDTPVPARGFLPTLFFALAIGLATAYLAFVNKMPAQPRPTLWGSDAEDIWQRTNFFARYTRAIVLYRAPLLRAAVVSLAFGVFLLPAAVFHVPRASSAATTTTPTTEIDWPTPPPDRPPRLAALLYERQLDRFVKELDAKPTPKSPSEEDVLAAFVAILGLLLVGFTATNMIAVDAREDPEGDVVVTPPAVR